MFKNRQKALIEENGFSLIDVVITVAIIIALSLGGFIAYTGIVDNAKQSAVDSASFQLLSSMTIYENDYSDLTDGSTALDEYNSSSTQLVAYAANDANIPSEITVPIGTTVVVVNMTDQRFYSLA